MRAKLPIELNQVYGKLTVIACGDADDWGHQGVLVKCECGNSKTVRASYLVSGHTKSCGCIQPKGLKRSRWQKNYEEKKS